MNTLKVIQKLKLAIVLCLAIALNPFRSAAQIDYVIGSGTTQNACTDWPSPFFDWYKSNKDQYLFLASELTAAGMGPGVITAVKWNVLDLYSGCSSLTGPIGQLNNYTIKIGTTTSASLTGYVAGITQPVYGPSTYTVTLGMNAFTLPSPLIWNGTDNIVVEVCHDNIPNAYTVNAAVNFTTTSFTSMYYNYSDGTGQCPATTGYTEVRRPNIIFSYGQPCNGVPTTQVAGPNEVCPNKPFNLSYTQFWSGITAQWQKSTNGTSWTNFTGPQTPGGITDAISVPTWYRAKLTCISSGQTFTTNPKLVGIAPFYYCYCEGSKATTAAGLDIGNVNVTTYPSNQTMLNNGVATPQQSNSAANKMHTDFRFTVPPVPMYHDSSYLLQVSQISSIATFAEGAAAIFIDYNRNGRFDPWERVLDKLTSQALPTPGVVRDTFTVPDTAEYGLTGMRVILRAGNISPDTCSSYPEGETEDYLVDLRYRPCDSKPTAGAIEGDTSMCVGYDYILTDTTYQTKKHGLSRLWQRSADAIGWVDVANSVDKDTLMRVFTGQPLFYRMRMICSHTNDTAYTIVHKVNVKPTYKCYCFSQSLGGANDSSDVGGFGIYNFATTDGGAHLGNPRAQRKRQDFTDRLPIEMWVDSIYQFHVYHTMPNEFHSDAKITVFADFNNNHQYDIPTERIYTGFTNVGYHTLISNLIIPNAAIVDAPTGLRVIINNNVGPNPQSDEACGTYISGETEDYMVIFRRPFNVGVNNTTADLRSVQVYPNPSSGRFNIDFYSGNTIKEVKVRILTVTGQQVISEIYSHDGGRFTKELNLESQAKGVYFVEIDADGVRETKRLVIK